MHKKKKAPTVRVDPHLGGGDVGGHAEVRDPQVLDLTLLEHGLHVVIQEGAWNDWRNARDLWTRGGEGNT